MTQATPNAEAVADFAASISVRELPPEVVEAARVCLVDWLGVAIAARDEDAARSVRQVVAGWGGQHRARILLGGTTFAAAAAMVNATMAHCLDFDDTHVGCLAHLSGPTWAAVFALGTQLRAPPQRMIAAFVAGFEAAARLGGGGLGEALNERSLHSTGVFGCLAAAVAASVLLQADREGIKRALGAAATQAAGLTASFGTMAKPFHAGKAAWNGVLAAELAAAGFVPALDLLEREGGLAAAMVQDRGVTMSEVDFSDGWEILRNTFKPYASCLLTHPVIDAGRELAGSVPIEAIARVRIGVHPMAIQLAGKTAPRLPLEGKFSTAYCAALALSGHIAGPGDFSAERLADSRLQRIAGMVELVPEPNRAKTSAWLELITVAGEHRRAEVPLARGNPGRPMDWSDIEAKFLGLVAPVLGEDANALFAHARRFDRAGDLEEIDRLVARPG